jgi:type II secretion system protein N
MTPPLLSESLDAEHVKTTKAKDEESPKPSRTKKALFITAGFTAFLLFTLYHLPEQEIAEIATQRVNAALATAGFHSTVTAARMTLWTGLGYSLEGVTLDNAFGQSANLDKIHLSPWYSSFFLLQPGAKVRLEKGDGSLGLKVAVKNGVPSRVQIQPDHFSLDQTGLLGLFLPIQFQGSFAGGEAAFDGNISEPATLNGNVNLQFENLLLPEQILLSVPAPRLAIGPGSLEGKVENGKLTISKFVLGESKPSSDIQIQITGDIQISKFFSSSNANLKLQVSFPSENGKKLADSFDTFIAGAKRPDGSYAFTLQGPIGTSFPIPSP